MMTGILVVGGVLLMFLSLMVIGKNRKLYKFKQQNALRLKKDLEQNLNECKVQHLKRLMKEGNYQITDDMVKVVADRLI